MIRAACGVLLIVIFVKEGIMNRRGRIVQRCAAVGVLVLGLAVVVAACGSTTTPSTSQTNVGQDAPTIQKGGPQGTTYFGVVADEHGVNILEASSIQAAIGQQLKQLGAPSGSVQIVEILVGQGASPEPYGLVGMKTGQVMRLSQTLTLVAVAVP